MAVITKFKHEAQRWPIETFKAGYVNLYTGVCTCGFKTLPKKAIVLAEERLTQHVEDWKT